MYFLFIWEFTNTHVQGCDLNDTIAKRCRFTYFCLTYLCFVRNQCLFSIDTEFFNSLLEAPHCGHSQDQSILLGGTEFWAVLVSPCFCNNRSQKSLLLIILCEFFIMGNYRIDFLFWSSASCRTACYFPSSSLFHIDNVCRFYSLDKGKQPAGICSVHGKTAHVYENLTRRSCKTCYCIRACFFSIIPIYFNGASTQRLVVASKAVFQGIWQSFPVFPDVIDVDHLLTSPGLTWTKLMFLLSLIHVIYKDLK